MFRAVATAASAQGAESNDAKSLAVARKPCRHAFAEGGNDGGLGVASEKGHAVAAAIGVDVALPTGAFAIRFPAPCRHLCVDLVKYNY